MIQFIKEFFKTLFDYKILKMIFKRKLFKHLLHPIKLYNFFTADPMKKNHPVGVQIEVTSLCNLKCEYCIHHKMEEMNKPLGHMSMETFKIILDKHKSSIMIHLQGQGEPFLHPQYIDMIKEVKKRGKLVTAFTNGTLLDKKRRKELLEAGFDLLWFSFDIAEKEDLVKMRKGLDYDLVVENFQNLVKERDAGGYSTVLAIHSVIYKSFLGLVKSKVIEFDKILKPDVIVILALAMASGDTLDYGQWYSRIGLDKEIIDDLPKFSDLSKYTKAIVLSNREMMNGRKTGRCDKANFQYYRWDGSTAFCGDRHTIDCDNPTEKIRETIKLMRKGIVPSECKKCQYLPPHLFKEQITSLSKNK